jgi:cytoskeletal protein CcmA (bactofilin family)
MFSKPSSNTPQQPATPATPAAPAPSAQPTAAAPAPAETPRPAIRAQKGASLIASDMVLEGDISGGGEIMIEGTVKGDVRVEHVTVGDGGQVEGGIHAEAVEVRGRVTGSITAKQVRLYGACHVDGDITHEQLAMETGAFFQGRSLRLQRAPAAAAPRPSTAEITPPRDSSLSAKSAPAAQA